MNATNRLNSPTRLLLSGIAGFAIGAALFAAVAIPAAAVYQPLISLDERCYQRSLDNVLKYRLDTPATGCVPTVVFVAVVAARYGPAMFLMPPGDIDIRAPIASALLFAVIGGIATASAGRRLGTAITAVALLVIEIALGALLFALSAFG